MATYRIGIGTEFKLDGGVGIGTDTVSGGLGDLRVDGTTKTTDLDVTGVSTFTRYAGFSADNIEIDQDRDLSLTGEHGSIGDIVVGVNSTFTVSTGATVDVGTVPSVSIGTHFSLPTGGMEDRPEAVHEGMIRFNEEIGTLEFYNGVEWREFKFNVGASGRAIWAGGYRSGGSTASIDSIQIPTQGNSVKFGELSAAGQDAHGLSSSTRGLFGGKFNSDAIEYITMASSGNSIDFGNMSTSVNYCGACGSSTRGMWSGGMDPSGTNVIQYVEINTLGNAADFGDLSATRIPDGGAFSSPTRGFAGGGHPTTLSTCDMWTISTKGNATDFGEFMSNTGYFGAGFSNTVRGVVAGGTQVAPGTYSKFIQTIIMSSSGNATDFGTMIVGGQGGGGSATATRGVYARGRQYPNASDSSALEMVDMQSGGNAVFFGDLRGSETTDSYSRHTSPCGDSHGGLGGY